MGNFINKLLESLKTFFGKLTKKERRRLIILAFIIVLLAVVITVVLSRTNYAVLYSGLTASEAGEALSVLENMSVPVQVQGTGTILVPEDRVTDLRMRLANEGYFTDKFSYSYSPAFGSTAEDRQMQYKIDTELYLQTVINGYNGIKKSYVVLVMPIESSFVLPSNKREASATVQVVTDGGRRLTPEEANTIISAVTNAVPGLKLENVALTDSNMHTYKYSDDEFGSDAAFALRLEYTERMQASLENDVIRLLGATFGPEHMRVMVTPKLNFDKHRIKSIEISPPVEDETQGMIVSIYELLELVRDDVEALGVPGTDENGLGTVEYPYGTLEDGENYKQAVREINYEFNQLIEEIEKAQGSLESLSVAVVLDESIYENDYSAIVKDIVSVGLGISDSYVSVQNMPFRDITSEIETGLETQQSMLEAIKSNEMIMLIIKGVIILLLVLFTLLFVRSIVKIATKKDEPEPVMAGANIDYITDDDIPYEEEEEEVIEDEVELNSKSKDLEQIENFIEKDPESIVQMLRTWISDE